MNRKQVIADRAKHRKGYIYAFTEDSLPPRKTRYLTNHGWEFRPKPRHPGWYKFPKRPTETEPNYPSNPPHPA